MCYIASPTAVSKHTYTHIQQNIQQQNIQEERAKKKIEQQTQKTNKATDISDKQTKIKNSKL
jgi:hypothetical protein